MNDAFGVGGVERVGDLDPQPQQDIDLQRLSRDAMFQGHAIQIFHGDEAPALVLADLVYRADVRVIEGGGSACLPAETLQRQCVLRDVVREKLQGRETAKDRVLGLVNHTHAAATKLLHDVVMRNGFVEHTAGGKSMLLAVWRGVNRVVDRRMETGNGTPYWMAIAKTPRRQSPGPRFCCSAVRRSTISRSPAPSSGR